MQRRSPYPKILFLAPLLFITLLLSAQSPADYIHTAPRRVPFPLNLSAGATSRYLCKGAASDEEKAWRLYAWEAKHIRYNTRSYQKHKASNPSPFLVLLRRKAVCEGYSELFLAMSKEAGLSVVPVIGYGKDFYFDPGDRFYDENHVWNAIKLSGKWYLIDVTFGAGHVEPKKMPVRIFLRKCMHLPSVRHKLRFVRSFSTDWFCSDPVFFRNTHDPVNPIWQLLEDEKDLHSFEGLRPGADTATKPREIPPSVRGVENEQADSYFASNELNRLTVNAAAGYEHNIRNDGLIASKELSLSSTFFNSGNNTGNSDLERIQAFRKALDKTNDAMQYLGCTRNDILDEYKFLMDKNSDKEKIALDEIKQVLDSNNRRIRYIVRLTSTNYARLARIGNQMGNEGVNAKVISKRSIVKVKTGKPSHLNDSLISMNTDSIRLNHHRIDSMQKRITTLLDQQEELKKLFQTTNKELFSDLQSGVGKTKRAVELRVNMEDSYKPKIRELKKDLLLLKGKESTDFKTSIEDGANGSVLKGLEIEKEIKKIRLRYVENEKYIKINKRLGQRDKDLDAAFEEENALLSQTIHQMQAVLKREKVLILAIDKTLNKDLWLYQKQNGFLQSESAVEHERKYRETKRLDKIRTQELRNNSRAMDSASDFKKLSLTQTKMLQKQLEKKDKTKTE